MARRIDPWVFGENLKGTKSIEHLYEARKCGLIAGDTFEAAAGETIRGECGDANGVEDVDPVVNISRDAARAV